MTTAKTTDVMNTDSWLAIFQRDRRHDGKFVYVGVTTGIYCRPSCPARHPHLKNILIFKTADEAEQQGYIACLRCHPSPHSLAPAEKSIKTALEYMENHLDQTITLDTLSQVSGLSPNHLQQTFKKIVGLSPKEFGDARRLARFKEQIKTGESIINACYGAGYGSSRALYEKAGQSLGMTPAAYRRGAGGILIHYAVTRGALGPILVAGTKKGICGIFLGPDADFLLGQLRREFPQAVFRLDLKFLEKSLPALRSCEPEDPLLDKLPLHLRHRIFQARVYHSLAPA